MEQSTFEPQSESEILRAKLILLLRLENVTPGPWQPEPNTGLLNRKVFIQVIIEEILKGHLQRDAGEIFTISVEQKRSTTRRVADYYGLWSTINLKAGERFIAFCTGDTQDVSELLREGNCEQLVEPNEALEDVLEAMRMEKQGMTSDEILAEAQKNAAQRGVIFSRYVLAKTKPQAFSSSRSYNVNTALVSTSTEAFTTTSSDFETLMQVLEDPKTLPEARVTYLTSIYEDLGMMDNPPRELQIRLLQTMVKLLLMPEAENLRDRLLNIYLPNQLRLELGPPVFTVQEVFSGYENLLKQVSDVLVSKEDSDMAKKLIEWIKT
jgi:hypothetical protein